MTLEEVKSRINLMLEVPGDLRHAKWYIEFTALLHIRSELVNEARFRLSFDREMAAR